MLATIAAPQHRAAVLCSSPAQRCRTPASQHPRVACNAKQNKGKDALSSLESLVPGSAPPPVPPPAAAQQPAEQQKQQTWVGGWWERPARPQTGPLRKRGMQPGTRGEYLDAEKLTRDPLELNVGSRTAIGDSLSLPEAPRPVVARTLAVVAAAAGLAFSLGLAPPLLSAGTASVALDGATWRLATAALQPVSLLNTCATVAALASCGQLAEKRLGSVLFAATFAAAGAASAICWYGASAASLQEGGALVAGASAALLGPAAALAGPYLLGNWSVLSGAQRGGCGAAALGLAAVWLTEAGLSVTGTPLDEVLSTPIHGVAAAVGLTLGAAAGPQLQVQRELDIKENSMTISGDEEELVVVIDRRTAPQRFLAVALAAIALWGLKAVADNLVDTGALLELLANWDAPEVQAELFEAMPDQWDLNA